MSGAAVKRLGKVKPIKLLGLPFSRNNQFVKPVISNNEIKSFLESSINTFPLTLVVNNKTNAFSYHLKRIVDDLTTQNDTINENLGIANSTVKKRDPNDLPLNIDYNIINSRKNLILYNNFIKLYPIKSLAKYTPSPKSNENIESNILLLSFNETALKNDSVTHFIKTFNENFETFFSINACILNSHIFPFLKNLSRTKSDNISVNMYNIAAMGLTNVKKLDSGTIILTN